MEKQIMFKKKGRADYMGFSWFYLYINGEPSLKNGAHVAYHCTDSEHAMRVYNQEINKAL